MKFIKYLFFFAIVFASCQKEESFELPIEKGLLSMDIDGRAWTAENVQAAYISSMLTVSGTTRDGRSIAFVIQEPKVGVFYNGIDDNGATVMYTDPAHQNGAFLIAHGDNDRVAVVEITEIDFEKKVFSGKFSFDVELMDITGGGADDVTIKLTNGKMANIEFSDESGNPNPGPGTGGTGKWTFRGTTHQAHSSSIEVRDVGGFGVTVVAVVMENANASQTFTATINIGGDGQVQFPVLVAVVENGSDMYGGLLFEQGVTDFDMDLQNNKIKFKFTADIAKVSSDPNQPSGPPLKLSGEVNFGY